MLTLEGESGPLVGVTEDILNILDKAPKYIGIVSKVLQDPSLDPFVARVEKIAALHKGPSAPPTPGTIAPPAQPGVGLQKFLKPMDAYIYAREHKWVLPAILGGAIVITAGLGFGFGRLSKRCKAAP